MEIALSRPLRTGVGRVSQWFGSRPEAYKIFGLAGHNGLDYATPIDSEVLAMHPGRLLYQADDPSGYGLHVKIVGAKFETLYAHLSQVLLPDGTPVTSGMLIAKSGSTGNSTGPHLHVGLRVTGMRNPAYANWIDPVPFRT